MSPNRSLHIGVIYDPIMATDCALDRDCPNRGAGIDASLIVCQYLNLSCTFAWASDRDEYGRSINGTWTGMIGDLVANRFDTAIPYFFPTWERSMVLDFSSSYFMIDQIFITRMPESDRLPDLDFSMIAAFRWPIWVCFLLSCLMIGNLISVGETVFDYFHTDQPRDRQHIVVGAYIRSMQYISNYGDRYRPYQSSTSNFLFTCWAVVSIVLSGAYSGAMFSSRIVSPMEYPFQDMPSFVQCIESGRCRFVASDRQDYLIDRLISSTNDESLRLAKAFGRYPPRIVDEGEMWSLIRNDKTLFWTTIDVVPFFYASTNYNALCAYYTTEAPFRDMATFPMPKNSSFKHGLDSAGRIFRDNGLSIGLSKKYERTAQVCQLEMSSSKTRDILSVYSIRSIIILYATGLALASVILMAEIWYTILERDRIYRMSRWFRSMKLGQFEINI